MSRENFHEFEKIIEYQFHNFSLLSTALTHSSFSSERNWNYERNNERLEFLGDAVLELISSDYIFHWKNKDREGAMTKLRASLVCERSLAESARQVRLGEFIRLGKGERSAGGCDLDSILSDAFEAVIGAIYLDGGMEAAGKFVKKYVLSDIENKQLFYDSKTVLQELVQNGGKNNISYEIISEQGPDHAKTFEVCCKLSGKVVGKGTGRNKKAAEQQAAYEAILKMRNK